MHTVIAEKDTEIAELRLLLQQTQQDSQTQAAKLERQRRELEARTNEVTELIRQHRSCEDLVTSLIRKSGPSIYGTADFTAEFTISTFSQSEEFIQIGYSDMESKQQRLVSKQHKHPDKLPRQLDLHKITKPGVVVVPAKDRPTSHLNPTEFFRRFNMLRSPSIRKQLLESYQTLQDLLRKDPSTISKMDIGKGILSIDTLKRFMQDPEVKDICIVVCGYESVGKVYFFDFTCDCRRCFVVWHLLPFLVRSYSLSLTFTQTLLLSCFFGVQIGNSAPSRATFCPVVYYVVYDPKATCSTFKAGMLCMFFFFHKSFFGGGWRDFMLFVSSLFILLLLFWFLQKLVTYRLKEKRTKL